MFIVDFKSDSKWYVVVVFVVGCKVSIYTGKRIISRFSGNREGPSVTRFLIGPLLPGLLAGARTRLSLPTVGSK